MGWSHDETKAMRMQQLGDQNCPEPPAVFTDRLSLTQKPHPIAYLRPLESCNIDCRSWEFDRNQNHAQKHSFIAVLKAPFPQIGLESTQSARNSKMTETISFLTNVKDQLGNAQKQSTSE